MKKVALVFVAAAIAILVGCGGGGGGGGGSTTLIGRVLSVVTGGPLSTPPSVQQAGGSPSTQASEEDGSFSLANVSKGATQVQVVPNQPSWPLFTFSFPAANGTTAIGDLWIGPEQVTVRGRVLSLATGLPIANASVSFGGQNGKTGVDGVFNLSGVGYSSETQTAFWGIVGTVRANTYFKTDFNAAPNVKDGSNVVNVGDIQLTPLDDPNPPGPPYNITGKVLATPTPAGCIVTLKQGATPIRVFNVGDDGKYFFWVTPGTYKVSFQKNAQTAPEQDAVVTQPNQVVTVPNVTLN